MIDITEKEKNLLCQGLSQEYGRLIEDFQKALSGIVRTKNRTALVFLVELLGRSFQWAGERIDDPGPQPEPESATWISPQAGRA